MRDRLILLTVTLLLFNGCTSTKSEPKITTEKINIINNNDFLSETALHDAIRTKDIELVKLLITKGANKDHKDKYGYTPLHLAVRLSSLEIVDYLIQENVNLNTIDIYKDTPLLDATRNNHTEISKLLICNGANINVKDSNNMSTLNNSSKNKNKYISELLIATDIDLYCKPEIEVEVETEDNNESDTIASLDIMDETTNSTLELNTTNELYKALMEEFENDFTIWDVLENENTISFRLKNTTMLFDPAQKNLKKSFKNILDNFFPRYINVLLYYKDDINKVIIEGHSSSEHSEGMTEEDKFQFNQELSQIRADEVLRYIKNISNPLILENFGWITTTTKSLGKSSTKLMYNDDETENKILSRRIEFVIQLKE